MGTRMPMTPRQQTPGTTRGMALLVGALLMALVLVGGNALIGGANDNGAISRPTAGDGTSR